ncbi:hypothetical protein N0V88_004168 [Collariella sp. IMI 366227]|nr:hypothetical protein N0V88_004168 [Collariella sp. IMI 366227]
MATRQERMRDRMRGAARHNVGDIDFGFIIPVAEEPLDKPEAPPIPEPEVVEESEVEVEAVEEMGGGVEEVMEEVMDEVERDIAMEEEEVEKQGVEEEEVAESTLQPLEEEKIGEPEAPPEKRPEEEAEEAEEVGEKEAAQHLGRKRSRRSLPAPSPELGSSVINESPAPKRRRRREAASPAKQQQPAKKPRKSTTDDTNAPSGSVPVPVQRFAKPPRPTSDADHGEDLEIPFTSRSGVNAVDVLSKLCEELSEAYMAKLEERGQAAADAATRREQKTMHRALEAFLEELRTRLLEHTIALDTMHSLRKRVRAAQKEKLALREEILRVRAEREQVALKMDAVRIRHEADSKEALRRISLSSTMHDIDMAVEHGQAAAELSPAEQKKADLANLELLISRIADQVSTRSEDGGALKQIRDFNAFLERTAAMLEGR